MWAETRSAMSPARIMVVDDDRETRRLLETVLTRSGYEVMTAANGLQLVRVLKVYRPDVILLDVVMNWIDGFELCRMLKNHPEWKDIAVVFITGLSEEQVKPQLATLNAQGCYYKPIDIRDLLDGIERLVDRRAATTT